MPIKLYALPDGRKFREGEPFAIDGVARFPSNWLEHAKPEELAIFGITTEIIPDLEPVPPPPPPPRTWRDVQNEAERALDGVHRAAMRDLIAGKAVDAALAQRASDLYAIIDAETGDPETVIPAGEIKAAR